MSTQQGYSGLTKFLNQNLFILKSERQSGYVYKFYKKDIQNGKTRYQCCRDTIAKTRLIQTLADGVFQNNPHWYRNVYFLITLADF